MSDENLVLVQPTAQRVMVQSPGQASVIIQAPGQRVTADTAPVIVQVQPLVSREAVTAPPELIVVREQVQAVALVAGGGPQGPVGATGPTGPRGAQGPSGAPGGSSYIWTQGVPSALWTITHGLERYPSVTVVDSAGTAVSGNVAYVDANTLTVTFSAAFGGAAYLN